MDVAEPWMGTGKLSPKSVQGIKPLLRVFGLLQRLAPSGCERDVAGNRRLLFSQYAGLVLLGLFNPTLQSLNGLSQLSRLRKVQRQIGGAKASVGSLSESVRVFDPALLENLFQELWQALPEAGRGVPGGLIPDELVRRLTAVDGTALRALPQLVAFVGDGKWRLHLQFEVWRNVPTGATLTPDEVGGNADERSVLAKKLLAGRIYIMDRGYERYTLLQQIVAAHSDYVCRVQRRPVTVLESRLLSTEALAAGIVSDELIVLGRSRTEIGSTEHPVRRVTIAAPGPGRRRPDRPTNEEIVLLTNLVDVPVEVIAAIYRLRWVIELFFKFFKHVLGCRQLLSHKPEGVAIQVYCALIAALVLTLAAGQSVGRRGFELVCLYLQGWAEEDELVEGLQRLTSAKTKR